MGFLSWKYEVIVEDHLMFPGIAWKARLCAALLPRLRIQTATKMRRGSKCACKICFASGCLNLQFECLSEQSFFVLTCRRLLGIWKRNLWRILEADIYAFFQRLVLAMISKTVGPKSPAELSRIFLLHASLLSSSQQKRYLLEINVQSSDRSTNV